jgi:anti-sigma B factor antagonist
VEKTEKIIPGGIMKEELLKIKESVTDGVCIISPSGDIDAHTSPIFKESIDRSISAGNTMIVFDFTSLNYISSAGIGLLNAALNTLKGKGGKMSIACASPAVLDTLDVMYFTKKVPARNDIQSAISAVKPA